MPYFPTEAWLSAYRRRLNDSDAFADLGAGWGQGHDGDVMYVITDLPVSETTLADLPPDVLDDIPEHMQERIADIPIADAPETFEPIKDDLPDDIVELLDQLDGYAADGTVYAYIGLEDGTCSEVEVLSGPEERDVGFVLRGSYGTWKAIAEGRPSSSAVLSGDLSFEGNRIKRLRYAPMFGILGDVAADVDSTHLFPTAETSSEPVLDTVMRGRSIVQRQLFRRFRPPLDLG